MVEQLRGVFALAIWDGDRCGELLPQDDFGIKPLYSDGIEGYENARRRAVEMDGFPLCSIDDVLESKRRSNRAKDRESLPRLEGFARFLKREQPPEIKPLPPRHRGSFGPR